MAALGQASTIRGGMVCNSSVHVAATNKYRGDKSLHNKWQYSEAQEKAGAGLYLFS